MSANHIPYLEDEGRKGETHARAIFGDKQADLLGHIAPEGKAVVEKYLGRNDFVQEAVAHVALENTATHEDWDQDRVDAVRQNQKTPVNR